MNNIERLILVNQFLILSKLSLSKEDKEKYLLDAEIIENGYVPFYEDVILDRTENNDIQIVIDIFDLYSKAYFSIGQLKNSRIAKNMIRIPGFDGNSEIEYMKFAKFIIEKYHRFAELYDDLKLIDYNAHSKQLNGYKHKLEIWNNLGKPCLMTEDQIIEIFNLKF